MHTDQIGKLVRKEDGVSDVEVIYDYDEAYMGPLQCVDCILGVKYVLNAGQMSDHLRFAHQERNHVVPERALKTLASWARHHQNNMKAKNAEQENN